MKKIGIVVFVAALVVGVTVASIFSFGRSTSKFFNFSFNYKGVKGSGTMGTDVRNVTDFRGIDVGGKFQVEVTSQKDYGVQIQADDNLMQYIRTDVRNGVLYIETTRKIFPSALRVSVSAPEIESLEVSGVADVTVTDLKSANLNLGSSGASKVELSGETGKFTASVSGATKIDAEQLAAVDASIDASGASSVTVNVSGELVTDASGASKILYTGTPSNINKTTSGASRVSPK